MGHFLESGPLDLFKITVENKPTVNEAQHDFAAVELGLNRA
jgi:hypothetical protein